MSEKKRYVVGCTAAADWEYIHELLTQDGTLDDNIPTDSITSDDLKEHSPTRASYLLTDEEAGLVRNHERVLYCDLAQEDFSPPQDELHATPQQGFRQVGISSHYRRWENNNSLETTGGNTSEEDMSRTGYQLLRHSQVEDPWYIGNTTFNGSQIFQNRVARYGSGKNVDLIVADEGFWLGHIEFYNPSAVRDITDSTTDSNGDPYVFGPEDMIEGNVLNPNGRCYALDLILDAPYYIDPDYFNASPGTRLETRWDGTVVPVSSVAVNWWRSTSNRSVGFSTFGTALVSTSYDRTQCNGTNAQRATFYSTHGTQCAAAAFGRTQGWGYNANKWVLNLYGQYGSGIEAGHDAQKLFHLMKPNNSELGTKDPTVSSNSWGYRAVPPDSGYYYYRGASGVSYQCTASNSGRSPYAGSSNTKPGFMRWVGYHGDGYRMKGEHPPNSSTQALDELINAGVIWVGAAGNSNQKQVSSDHPDFNNYWNTGIGDTVGDNNFTEFGVRKYPYTNRRGWPQHGGMIRSGVGGTVYTYPVINIGALDDDYYSTLSYKECKVNYSDMGNEIDCYAAADGILTAKNITSSGKARHDTKPSGESGFQYYYDNKFSGTSAACPVAAGVIATKMEYNRTWGWQDVRNWLRGENQPVGVTTLARQDSASFHFGSDTGVSGAGDGSGGPWSDTRSLEGSLPIVIYDAPTGNEPEQSSGSPVIEGVKVFSGEGIEITGNITISYE